MARGSVLVVLTAFGAGFTSVTGFPGCDRAVLAADAEKRCYRRLRGTAAER